MKQRILRFSIVVSAILLTALACRETPEVPEQDDPVTAPAASIEVGEQTRTSITFTIGSDAPGDYAWDIVDAGETFQDAEELFKTGKSGMFGQSNSVTLTYNELEGGKQYTLYYAVRKINPYVYSDLKSESITTEFAYEDMITLEKVTPTSITYHIEKPEDAAAYRHMIVDYNDFLYFQAIIGATHDSYLSAFGLGDDESKTFSYDWVQFDGWDNYPTYFYSDTKYIILAGKSAGTDLEAQVRPEDVKYIEFTTPKAELCQGKVNVEVSDITSLTATVTMTPEEGVERFRTIIMSESDYAASLFEGEEMLRRMAIGPWDDLSNEYRETTSLDLEGLLPDTKYYICIVAFDENLGERYIEETFFTTEPTGPAPEIYITEGDETEEPWNSATVNLKIRNAVSALSFVETKFAVDQVLNAPGNEDLTMDVVIRNNGTAFDAATLSATLSEGGAKLGFSNLSANTEYVFAVLATNQEHVSSFEIYDFKTAPEPVVETTLFDKLKGEYTAEITDLYNVKHTFDVTITDGVNEATKEEYAANNLLVCLGFDACGIEYHSPQDLLDKKWASSEEEANRNYGPKWFLQIGQDETITTYKHAVINSYWDEVNQTVITSYSAEGEPPMASFNGRTIWFKGTFWRDFTNPNKEDQAMASILIHNVDFDERTGKVTVLPVTHYTSWSAKGQKVTEYPGVEEGHVWSGMSNEVIFCGNSPLVLTPKENKSVTASIEANNGKPITVPVKKVIDLQTTKAKIRR